MFHTSDQLSPHAAPDRTAGAELYMSLELSPSKWLVTSLLSGSGRTSKHILRGASTGITVTSEDENACRSSVRT